MKESLRTSRYPNRTSEDRELINQILDEARFCTVAYADDHVAHQIPTGFCRLEDEVYIHGSVKSHFISRLLESPEVSLSIMLCDALVLAPTAFNHSVNYRSVVLYSGVREVRDVVQKARVLSAYTDKYIPGRMQDLPQPTPEELSVTTVLALSTNKSLAKTRTGGVGVDTSKSNVWSGIVPVRMEYGTPEVDQGISHLETPHYLNQLITANTL
ncbi:MAG: pyridoxamine 5'-phosphate oxidase family protein [Marinoscillum sp.]|uniref:pyridoxamine 5'-phosphate oxidase family protein n=1 Tax=Marinoscillum sp. TaxID=2024838 RepID=UPI0032FE1D0B